MIGGGVYHVLSPPPPNPTSLAHCFIRLLIAVRIGLCFFCLVPLTIINVCGFGREV